MNAIPDRQQATQLNEPSSQHELNASSDDLLPGQAIALVEQLQLELNTVRDQLAHSNRLGQLGMLTAALAHETNNLLTPIRSYAQLALASPDDNELNRRALQIAIDATDKAGRLVERAMGLAAPHDTIQTPVCDAGVVVDGAIGTMAPVLQQFAVRVGKRIDSVAIAIDALALEQVLINLISNACQAMVQTEGKRTVQITSEQVGRRLVLSVTDNGPGVPTAIRDELFEPFVTDRAKTPASGLAASGAETSRPGSGLGLSICRQLLEEAGGQITLADSSEAGCRFEIDLPLAAEG